MFFYNSDKKYNQFSQYLKQELGSKVYKVTIDAGFSCPNRDGTISKGGCLFCDDGGSFSQAHSAELSVVEQLNEGISNLKRRFKAQKFLSYLQAYSNTYADVCTLKKIYSDALNHPDVVGMSIGTRPDCVDEEKLDLIAEIASKYHTWLEFGLQTIHDETLRFINRGHDYATFEKAYHQAKQRGINVCVHVILGLPNETEEQMLATAKKLGELKVDGVKLHQLCVLENTQLARLYEAGQIKLLEQEKYIDLCCRFMEHLSPETKIHRLTGNGLVKNLIAPKWLPKKFEVLNSIDDWFNEHDSYQGRLFLQD